jgi:rhodanese-related sulfurtransferase
MIEQIRPAQLAQWLQTHQAHGQAVVLDVREPHELQLAQIKPQGFDLIAIPMGVIPPRLQELNPQQPIACLCHHGMRSMQVAHFLHSRGFERVANIAGGIHAWSAELDASVAQY